jgi:hypothetical protein
MIAGPRARQSTLPVIARRSKLAKRTARPRTHSSFASPSPYIPIGQDASAKLAPTA